MKPVCGTSSSRRICITPIDEAQLNKITPREALVICRKVIYSCDFTLAININTLYYLIEVLKTPNLTTSLHVPYNTELLRSWQDNLEFINALTNIIQTSSNFSNQFLSYFITSDSDLINELLEPINKIQQIQELCVNFDRNIETICQDVEDLINSKQFEELALVSPFVSNIIQKFIYNLSTHANNQKYINILVMLFNKSNHVLNIKLKQFCFSSLLNLNNKAVNYRLIAILSVFLLDDIFIIPKENGGKILSLIKKLIEDLQLHSCVDIKIFKLYFKIAYLDFNREVYRNLVSYFQSINYTNYSLFILIEILKNISGFMNNEKYSELIKIIFQKAIEQNSTSELCYLFDKHRNRTLQIPEYGSMLDRVLLSIQDANIMERFLRKCGQYCSIEVIMEAYQSVSIDLAFVIQNYLINFDSRQVRFRIRQDIMAQLQDGVVVQATPLEGLSGAWEVHRFNQGIEDQTLLLIDSICPDDNKASEAVMDEFMILVKKYCTETEIELIKRTLNKIESDAGYKCKLLKALPIIINFLNADTLNWCGEYNNKNKRWQMWFQQSLVEAGTAYDGENSISCVKGIYERLFSGLRGFYSLIDMLYYPATLFTEYKNDIKSHIITALDEIARILNKKKNLSNDLNFKVEFIKAAQEVILKSFIEKLNKVEDASQHAFAKTTVGKNLSITMQRNIENYKRQLQNLIAESISFSEYINLPNTELTVEDYIKSKLTKSY